jgi:hypothetical protein
MKIKFIYLAIYLISTMLAYSKSALAKLNFQDFHIIREGKNLDENWFLFWKDKKLSSIKKIGPSEPQLLRLEEKENLFLLYYDAGIAGTRIQTQLERVVILTMKDNSVEWVQDHLFKLSRFQGEKTLFESVRDIQLKDNLLILNGLDDESPMQYRWVQNQLLPQQ